MPAQAYLKHVNGLRAVAIAAIVVYHLRATYCPAGYFGVDVFLVICGFFLFRKLMKPQAGETFRYGGYVLHKAWRILPPWFVVTLCFCAVGFFCMVETPVHEGFRTARNSVFLLADFRIDHAGNYFNPDTQENPLLHFWYLSVVCQLYLLAPLLVIPLVRRGFRRAANILLGVLALLSLCYWVLTTTGDLLHPDVHKNLLRATLSRNSYYHLIPRFWEIVAGYAVLSLPDLPQHPKLRSALGFAGLAGMAVSFFLFETGSPCAYPAVLAAMLAVKYGDRGPAAAILGLKPVQWLGTVSFSLYLWHWPVMAVYKYVVAGQVGLWDEAAMLALSLALAWLTWRFVEKGVSMPKQGAGSRFPMAKYAVLLSLPLILGVACWGRGANNKQFNAELRDYFKAKRVRQPDFPALDFTPRHAADAALTQAFPLEAFVRPPRYLGKNSSVPPTYLFMGDSHAQHLEPGLDLELTRAGRRGVSLNNSVLPVWGHIPAGSDKGDAKWDKARAAGVLAYLQAHPSIRYVVISLYWYKRLYLNSGQDWDTGKSIPDNERADFLHKGLAEMCRRIAALGKTVVLVGDTPTFAKPGPYVIWKRRLKLGLELPPTSYVDGESFRRMNAGVDHVLSALVQDGSVAAVIDPSVPLLALSEQGCPDSRQSTFLYYDADHLTTKGSLLVAPYLMRQLLQLEKD